ncbi:flagellar protein [Paenibacillus darwinianus]|uniref:Flagellar protein n=1 Tax=Paenibacillus darwinianus TaxID=1380763 RepID=A0A9W5S2D5_9BACL|nr:flagellar protein [Paenibacillus darwinianus]EXX88235.1 flagellar protein [Paenibacillus darwinianus]EXX89010.1 flagellar protein [Paenibacillus darwinianus]EXX89415.1 flagellar protein [Paenibacillus darwinianus]
MSLENCPRCGKIFSKGIRDICPSCVKEVDKEYDLCTIFIKENKQCSMQELSEGTGVSVRQITRFIREGRISIVRLPNLSYSCESCGAPIRDNTMCVECRSRLAAEMKESSRKPLVKPEEHRSGYQIGDRLRDRT